MNTKKIEKWFETRGEIIIPEQMLNSVLAFLSDRKIDRQTSSDLLLDDYFKSIDRAVTAPGRSILFAILHAPLSGNYDIQDRLKFIKTLSENKNISKFLNKSFWKVRFSQVYSINSILFENTESLFSREKLALLLLFFIFLVITVPLLYTQPAVYSILLFFIISFLFYARNLSII